MVKNLSVSYDANKANKKKKGEEKEQKLKHKLKKGMWKICINSFACLLMYDVTVILANGTIII